jgi:lantibiotic leader peptide-processing serine protease
MKASRFFPLLAVLACFLPSGHAFAAETKSERQIITAKSDADYDVLKGQFVAGGGMIVKEMKPILSFVGSAPMEIHQKSAALAFAKSQGLYQVAADNIRHLIRPEMKREFFGTSNTTGVPALKRTQISLPAAAKVYGSLPGDFPRATALFSPDPAFGLAGLMWNYSRINADDAWAAATGEPTVLVGVADTGLDYTHSELKDKVSQVIDLTDSTLCKTYYTFNGNHWGDADLASYFGGPADTDWNGHGTWIGGNIAAVVDGAGINGIAPNVNLVSLKISEWCGSAYDSSILSAFIVAAENGIDVVSISFGGYTDPKDPVQKATYVLYKAVVAYAKKMGTVIVAAAGNEHVRIDSRGKVVSHGSLTTPGDTTEDYFGQYETPAGVPGVVMVSSSGNNVESYSSTCADGTTGDDATCKPKADTHQPFGMGKQDQLAYYSNYGTRIDIAAPGGARKFNLPYADRGGTAGWPVTTTDGYSSWEDFSITSNWATDITCYTFDNTQSIFPVKQCYSNIQGSSMATPHVSAAMALVASVNSSARHKPDTLIKIVKSHARKVKGNKTPPLSKTDKTAGDLTGVLCSTGYCHLGGKPISDREAYGAGILDVYKAVTPKASRIQ